MKPKSKKHSQPVASVSDWSDTIARIGEESRRKQDERVAKLQAELPVRKRELKFKTNDELVELLMESRGSHDPRETEIWAVFREAVKKEVLRRLSAYTR